MKINIKNIKVKSICATLFISLFLSCNNGGPEIREGQAATADGTVIDLKTVSKKIKEASEFAVGVKEIGGLVDSLDGLAKGIGKKIVSSGIATESTHNNKNNGLMAGVYEVALLIETKAKNLQVGESLGDRDLQTKVDTVKTKAEAFKNKLTNQHTDLGSSSGTTDTNAQQAIDRKTHGSNGTHGAKELAELYAAVTVLMKTAKDVLKETIKGIAEPVKIEFAAKVN
ncbi:hypothetical protein bcCo53_001603 (plasmid) [Borrelia coriaceae]|uniref:Variable outer membrane protein n=1 Tax=Borrelia coriaceae ATCC 43381 TaxID=1408429 RepID=W5SXM5_9SPIR|nr:Vsp/OspC family lipoprotein [Borrelia coriaceae]AHH11438.1 Variable outer membrane protein [Borrelia coriaceae ATCC 43381]UPA17406.1 hypothetical protein bcCo53_001603 [Borrelia coriaceae]